jgi:cardiolipin synthase
MSSPNATHWTWMRSGDEVFPAMLAAIGAAQKAVSLETYMLAAGKLSEEFRAALIAARERGVAVRLMIDAIGSLELPDGFLVPLRAAGVEVRVFNPLALGRLSIRNHRKLLVCDEQVAFVGGFNIADDYVGDGVTRGWRDVGARLEGALVHELAATFNEMFALTDFRHKRPIRLARARLKKILAVDANDQLLLSGPGRGRSPIRRALLADLRSARRVQIIVPYFIPSWRIRRLLAGVARRGGQVQLLLPGKSDVALVQLAGRSLYRRLLRAGVEIYEYQPQVLHGKLFVMDDNVYVGSSNLDPRSLSINYELLVRRHDAAEAARARAIFSESLAHSRRIDREELKLNSGLWTRLKEYFAYWLLVRIDPHVARKQWRALPE